MFLFSALPPIILGFAALVALKLVYGNQRVAAGDAIVLIVTVAGWTMIFIGMSMMVTPLGMILVLLIFAMTVAKYREGERRALLLTLAVAAEKGLPLSPSVRGYATRRCDEMARRAWLLADLLDAGVPLQKALADSGNPLPNDALLMVRLGTDPQAMAAALRESAEQGGQLDDAWRPIFDQTMYLLVVAIICVFITAFIMINIIPTFNQIFSDFGTQLPAISQLMIAGANWCAQYWFLFFPFFVYLFVVFPISAFFYARGKVWIPWPFHLLFDRSDNPTVLRGLAICVERQLPMDQALSRLGYHYPRKDVAKRLANAAGTTAVGKDWCDSLCEENIITKAESAVLKSAARAGNLAWALREMAEVGSRRAIYRAKIFLNIATPVCLLLMAVPVALVVFGCMVPLVSLIQNLT